MASQLRLQAGLDATRKRVAERHQQVDAGLDRKRQIRYTHLQSHLEGEVKIASVDEPEVKEPSGIEERVRDADWYKDDVVLATLEAVIQWSQYWLNRLDLISDETAAAAARVHKMCSNVYMVRRSSVMYVLEGHRTVAMLWYVAISQLLVVSRVNLLFDDDDPDRLTDASELALPPERELLLLGDGPVIEFTLNQCIMTLHILIEDAMTHADCDGTQRLRSLLTLRLALFVCFMWPEDEMDDPNFAHMIVPDKRMCVLNVHGLVAMERSTFHASLPTFVRARIGAATPCAELLKSEAAVLRIDGIRNAITQLAEQTQSDALRRSFQTGVYRRALMPHEHEKSGLDTRASAKAVLQRERMADVQKLSNRTSLPWPDLLLGHSSFDLPLYNELILQFFHFLCEQRLNKHDFAGSYVVRWTQLAEVAPILLFRHRPHQTTAWKRDAAFPFIFDMRPRPLVVMGASIEIKDGSPRVYECADMCEAAAVWSLCVEQHCPKTMLKGGVNAAPWFKTLSSTKSMTDVKTGIEFEPVSSLRPELMKSVHAAMLAAAHAHTEEGKAQAAAARRLREEHVAARERELRLKTEADKTEREKVEQLILQEQKRVEASRQAQIDAALRQQLIAEQQARIAAAQASGFDNFDQAMNATIVLAPPEPPAAKKPKVKPKAKAKAKAPEPAQAPARSSALAALAATQRADHAGVFSNASVDGLGLGGTTPRQQSITQFTRPRVDNDGDVQMQEFQF